MSNFTDSFSPNILITDRSAYGVTANIFSDAYPGEYRVEVWKFEHKSQVVNGIESFTEALEIAANACC